LSACRPATASASLPGGVPRPFSLYLLAAGLVFFLLTGVSGCSGPGQFVWYSRLPRSEWGSPAGEYTIGIGDTIGIRVYQQEDLSLTAKIRRDGRVALPLIGEVMVAGKQPSALARELEGRLKQFVVSPRITINVEQSQPITISTLGEISKVGTLTLEPPANMIQALAQAGGPGEFADKSRIFLLRQFPSFQRIRFTYDAVLNNESGAATFPLRTGDVLVID
jgi:polysaccharide biosynthesis/export protein